MLVCFSFKKTFITYVLSLGIKGNNSLDQSHKLLLVFSCLHFSVTSDLDRGRYSNEKNKIALTSSQVLCQTFSET